MNLPSINGYRWDNFIGRSNFETHTFYCCEFTFVPDTLKLLGISVPVRVWMAIIFGPGNTELKFQ